MKVDKRRKKKQREEEEQAADPIFGGSDSDDGGDYNPEAAEEPEYIEAGADQGDEPDSAGDEEAGEDDRPHKKARQQRMLAGTGLAQTVPYLLICR